MEKVAVVGAGVMGIDMSITLAGHGYYVILKDQDGEVLNSVYSRVKQNIRRYKFCSSTVKGWKDSEILERIKLVQNYDDFSDVSWVVENITENYQQKEILYKELNQVCNTNTKYAVNTSCISITKIASLISNPQNVIGMHFMNPVPLKEVVEIIKGYHTSEEVVKSAMNFAESLSMKPVVINDMTGFVSNRLSHLFMNEAAFLVQDQVATANEIDIIFKLGYGHKMGPLETADLIGLDTVVNSLEILYNEYQDTKFRCCPLLKKMVAAGLLGRKSGQGFYTYSI